jgi:hypothetical protein
MFQIMKGNYEYCSGKFLLRLGLWNLRRGHVYATFMSSCESSRRGL